MQAINKESRTSVHFQLNYVIAMPWSMDAGQSVEFQKNLLDNGLEFSQTQNRSESFILIRNQPSHLQVKLDSPGPQISAVQILSGKPGCDLEMFGKDCRAVMEAWLKTFNTEQCQLIQSNAKINHLYSSQDHAFKYLWENRLGQMPEDFKALGPRPVVGGGLRLMLPPHQTDENEPQSIEIRIESFLREPRKLKIETIFGWPRPRTINNENPFDPQTYLKQVEDFADNEIWNFLTNPKGQDKE